ncbi:hypothetical protein [Streptomyces qaidamensis]|uniref:hypothetical protein n=1 Tax=Streptomyces qaidamensis TaxID=1783515 RepID=UPI000B06A9BE|nr:hypothetical protein [Streptomyces qaidamensis]
MSEGHPGEAGGRSFERVAGELRERMASGRYPLNSLLPPQCEDLEAAKLVPSVEVRIRHTPLTPTFKLYVINGVEVLHGPYQVVERELALDSGEQVRALDVLGLGATLTHHVQDGDPDSAGSVFVSTMRNWYDSVWNMLSEAR